MVSYVQWGKKKKSAKVTAKKFVFMYVYPVLSCFTQTCSHGARVYKWIGVRMAPFYQLIINMIAIYGQLAVITLIPYFTNPH